MKDWLYRKFFQKQYLKWSKQGYDRGYSHGKEDQRLSDELQSMEMVKSWLIDPDKVFSTTKTGIIMLNGKQITSVELKNLKAEVRTFQNFMLYGILVNSIRKLAIDKAVLTATDLYSPKGNEQVLAGKMMIYNIDIIQTIINRIDKAKIT